jgi:hypothetical protein
MMMIVIKWVMFQIYYNDNNHKMNNDDDNDNDKMNNVSNML